ncbi:hypothetical protein PROVRETT_06525 [Providencia rettgeri DSM 1131]|nr:hypothetical protein PROVRETT_06525 [Providencia rettgeri DSM 1131]
MQKIAKLRHVNFIILTTIQLNQYNRLVDKNGYINKIHNKFKIRYYYKLNILFSRL